MKKLLSAILAVTLLLSCFVMPIASAEDVITVTIDGAVQNYNVNPVIIDGRTLVPMRAVFESLGAEVEWDGETRTVTGKSDKTEVTLVIDNKEAKVNGRLILLDVPAQLIDSSTMVPARFVADAFGYDVDWNAETKTVAITKNENSLYSAVPEEWQKRVIGRARQMSEVTYTPVRDIPTHVASKQKGVLEAGKEYKGIPYTSNLDETMGENTSFETFLTAVANPDSVLYT